MFLFFIVIAATGLTGASEAFADEALAERAGCMDCHNSSRPGIGPTFEAIAARYREDSTAPGVLGDKISLGGAGNWAEETGGLTMPPYYNLLSIWEVQALVDWVLAQ